MVWDLVLMTNIKHIKDSLSKFGDNVMGYIVQK